MWIKSLHVGRLALTAAAVTDQMSPGCVTDRVESHIDANKSSEEHMDGGKLGMQKCAKST